MGSLSTCRGLKLSPISFTPAADGIRLARLLVQEKGLSDLVQVEVPRRIVLNAPVVTKDNVDKYLPLGFKS